MNDRFAKNTVPAAKTIEAPKAAVNLEEIAEASQKRYDAGRFAPKDEDALWRLADMWYRSGLLPESYYPGKEVQPVNPKICAYPRWEQAWIDRGVARAVIVMRYGASLGVLPEIAIRQIYIVEGQPSPAASLMLALAFGSGVLSRKDWRIVKSDALECQIELFGSTRTKPESVVAKYDEYKHLHGKTNWKNYPQDMLVARATSRAMRRYFPDQFGGVYAAEERVDFRADRAAGHYDDVADRILSAVDDAPHDVPPPADNAATNAPTPESAPIRPAPTKAEWLALAEQIKAVGEQVTAEQLEGLKAEFLRFDRPEGRDKRCELWNANEVLRGFWVAS